LLAFAPTFRILSIQDVPNDQGRQARVTWSRNPYDDAGADSLVVTEYSLWRRVDHNLSKPLLGEGNPPLDTPPGDWDFIATIPAVQDSTYNYVAPTLADSNLNDGMYYSVFFVRAHTSNPLVHWETEPDSGYSVDNLAPAVPKGLTADISDSTVLTWLSNSEPDLAYYAIYRGSCPDFTPGTPLAYTTDTTYIDMETGYCYMVSAFDFAGNESPLTGPVSVGEDGAQPELPDDFSLSQNYPNPFNPTTEIRYTLPRDCQVRLEVYSILGQRVVTLVDERQQAGYRSVRWDASSLASGIYFYRLQAGDFVETKRMILLK